jgi:hypothetical protein
MYFEAKTMEINSIYQTYFSYLQNRLLIPELHPTNTLSGNILKRLVFNDCIDKNIDQFHNVGIDNSFLKTVQVNLLLSSSDALGSKLYAIKPVKKRFFEYWKNRSDEIKNRLVLYYHPNCFKNWELKYELIINIFYEKYRNPFTHETMSNVPPVYAVKSKQGHPIGQIMAIGFSDEKDNVSIIDIPIFEQAAMKITDTAKHYFWILDNGKFGKEIKFNNYSDLLQRSAEICSYKNPLDELSYIHSGLLKVISMAIIEGYNEIEKS